MLVITTLLGCIQCLILKIGNQISTQEYKTRHKSRPMFTNASEWCRIWSAVRRRGRKDPSMGNVITWITGISTIPFNVCCILKAFSQALGRCLSENAPHYGRGLSRRYWKCDQGRHLSDVWQCFWSQVSQCKWKHLVFKHFSESLKWDGTIGDRWPYLIIVLSLSKMS